jgi:hypothetical protein
VLTIGLRIIRPGRLVLFNLQGLHIGSDSIIVVEHTNPVEPKSSKCYGDSRDGKDLLRFLLPYHVLVEILC